MEMVERVVKNFQALGAFLMSTPEAQRFVVAQAEEDHQARVALAREAGRLTGEHVAEQHRYAAELAPLQAAVERAEAAVTSAREAMSDCMVAHGQKVSELDRLLGRCRNALEASAPAAIRAFETELRAEVGLAHERFHQREAPGWNGRGVTWSNQASVEARQTAALNAARDVQRLALEALTPEELEARFAAIRASLPAVEPTPEDPPSSVLGGLSR